MFHLGKDRNANERTKNRRKATKKRKEECVSVYTQSF